MTNPKTSVQSNLDYPLIFRTSTESVYRSTTENGEIWLRSDECFRSLEDKVRNDALESLSAAGHKFPLLVSNLHLEGDGNLSEEFLPHYILSLHGTSIKDEVRRGFGGFTFGVKNIDLLARHIFEECRKQIACTQWEWAPIAYQYSALKISEDQTGAPIQVGHDPSRFLGVWRPSPFRKRPIPPFIYQDEWRIVLRTNGYINRDSSVPLKVRVPPSLFYEYLEEK